MRLLIFALIVYVNSLPIGQNDVQMAMDHLQKFGYMAEYNKTMDDDVLTKSLKKYQMFMGLNVTGKLDVNTTNLMNAPRCGMLDTGSEESALSRDRSMYINVTYKIITYPLKKDNIHYDDEIEAAFEIWSKYTNLHFTSTKRRQNITIEFRIGNHRDSQAFDGPGQVLGHASPKALVVHFDADEHWSENETGINVYQTAAHEIGHVLGLPHSNNPGSIMYAVFEGFNPNFRKALHPEDITNIQDMYGMRANTSVDSTNQDHPLNFNIIFRTNDNLTYLFFQKTYIEYDASLKESARGNIDDKWKLLPANIDAAVHSRKNGKMYFFKGGMYWRYTGAYMDARFPRSIYMGFSGIYNAEAVLHFRSSLYFFYYRDFWEYRNLNEVVPTRSIKSYWPGVPNLINGAINIDNNTIYFFKRSRYYIFDTTLNKTRQDNICNLFKC